jgi:hypothetical protein
MWIAITAAWIVSIAIFLFAGDRKDSSGPNAYSHGTTTCLEGCNGPGLELLLKQAASCEKSWQVYPHLEIEIRERPIRVHKSVIIGPENWAFRCLDPKESCEQSLSGKLVFEHFEENVGKEMPLTDGYYELRFRSGTEQGRFKVECSAPCA